MCAPARGALHLFMLGTRKSIGRPQGNKHVQTQRFWPTARALGGRTLARVCQETGAHVDAMYDWRA